MSRRDIIILIFLRNEGERVVNRNYSTRIAGAIVRVTRCDTTARGDQSFSSTRSFD